MKKYFKLCTLVIAFMLAFALPISAQTVSSTTANVKSVEEKEDINDKKGVNDKKSDEETPKSKPQWVIEKNELKLEKKGYENDLKDLEKKYKAIEDKASLEAVNMKKAMDELEKNIQNTEDKINEIKVFFKGKEVKSDINPVLKNGRVLIPLRALAEVTGAEVTWNQEKELVTVSKDGYKIIIPLGETYILVDDEKIEMEVPAKLENNRTIVPVRFIAKYLNQQVNWDAESKSVDID